MKVHPLQEILVGSLFLIFFSTTVFAVDTNTVSSTVVTDKAPPTASAPSIVINNSDVCKSAFSAGVQTQIFGIASGITVTDQNCERMKLSRSLYGMGMKVAAVSTLCQDARVFDAMLMAGTPCPYKGKIGKEALQEWKDNPQDIPSGTRLMSELKKKSGIEMENQEERKNDQYQDQHDGMTD
jgi:hypothetical protein|tara:strand:- start:35 stop:580 length:546 start_codon:yes stop_codon:yes gene_type:complete